MTVYDLHFWFWDVGSWLWVYRTTCLTSKPTLNIVVIQHSSIEFLLRFHEWWLAIFCVADGMAKTTNFARDQPILSTPKWRSTM